MAEKATADYPLKRQSIEPTYDSRESGLPYLLTVTVDNRTITNREPMADPFHNTRVVIGWRDLLRGLARRRLEVTVAVDADRALVEDVMELDANYLGMNCTRRDEFNVTLGAALFTFAHAPEP